MIESSESKSGIYKHMLRGTAWSAALRWGIRGIGLVSVVILARLLTPEDFGIVAMGALAITFIGTFSELGVQTLLIREQDVGRDECDTAWTLSILQGVFVALVVIVVAPFAADYFDDQRVIGVLYVLAAGAVFSGVKNIGMVLARKELDFARDFRFNLYIRIISFVITIYLAFSLRTYWALVIGQVFASFISIPLSFVMHPYRPRLSLAKAGKYLKFSTSIVPLRFGRFLNGKVDVILIGGIAGAGTLGVYNVALDLSSMFTQEILGPLGRGLMPSYAKLKHDPVRLAEAYSYVFRVAAIVVLPLGVGLSVVAADFVLLVLGDQWAAAIPLVEILAIYAMLGALVHLMTNQILIVSGHERTSAIIMWARLAFLAPVLVVASQKWGVDGVAVSRLVVVSLVLPVVITVLSRAIPLSVADILSALWRPCLAAVGMGLLVHFLSSELEFMLFFRLLIEVFSGVAIYFALLAILWWLSGRPAGIEKLIFEAISSGSRLKIS